MKTTFKINHKGQILIALTITVPALILIIAAYMTLSLTSFRSVKHDQLQTHAQLAADAGIDYALEQINLDEDWAGSGGEVELHNDGAIKSTYSLTVTTIDEDNKTITATGKGYSPITISTPGSTVKLSVNLRPVRSGTYSVVSGQGGLYMRNNAKITGGDVFVNGEIEMRNSSQIGLSTSPVNLDVAHQNCPVPSDVTYPRLCGSGENGQPIDIDDNAHIYGTVEANNQTDGSGMSDPGLVASSGVTPEPFPPHDRAAQIAAVTAEMTNVEAGCETNNIVKTWPANLRIHYVSGGEDEVDVEKNCKIYVEGDVWLDNTKLEMENQGQLIVAEGVTTPPVIMLDDDHNDFENDSKLVANSLGVGFKVIAYWSAATCSPDCTDVTGVDLYNSRNKETIHIKNSFSGPETLFYSRWGRVKVDNSGSLGALIGQTIELKNNATVTFGTSTGGSTSTTWVLNGYRRVFD